MEGDRPTLIVDFSNALGVKTVPVWVDSHNLTREISAEEDARLAQPAPVDAERTAELFWTLFRASPPSSRSDSERAKVVLCRLLLGPVTVPCFCEEWDVDEYMTRCAYNCRGPVLYAHREWCRCSGATGDGRSLKFVVMQGHHATHVFRGLLSLAEWNAHLPGVFCACNVFKSDRYVMAALPGHITLLLNHYPYLLRHICRFLTVPEIDECVSAMVSHLGKQIAARINIHYKILFGIGARLHVSPRAAEANRSMFFLELQKLWISLDYNNTVTNEFFETVFRAFHEDLGRVMLLLRLPGKTSPIVPRFSTVRFKKQVLYFKLAVKYSKTKKEITDNSFCYRRLVITFGENDVVWRNLFVIYYHRFVASDPGADESEPLTVANGTAAALENGPAAGNALAASGRNPPTSSSASLDALLKRRARPAGPVGTAAASTGGTSAGAMGAKHYVRVINRLNLVRFREVMSENVDSGTRPNVCASPDGSFDFSGTGVIARYGKSRAWTERYECRYEPSVRRVVGGREFAEITAVSLNRMTANAFNTNRVINLKAALSRTSRPTLGRSPRNMTHSFVMYKHTFKEPACTVSTFVSNDAAYTNSLNVNIRGTYLEFLYALGVYRLYVAIENFFLPASVCNSNSSLDIHGLEDQTVIRSGRSKVYWTTNFPCMISTTDNINVGWFKAATAIVPKVSGRQLENIMLKELAHISGIREVSLDYGVHRMFTAIETRNSYQVPFLSKQFILFLRTALIKMHGWHRRVSIDHFLFRAVRYGIFDYQKEMVAHTKIKHACALIGTRLSNNVPKILVRNKKVKLDHPGRNANILTLCRHVDTSRVDACRLRIFIDVLQLLLEGAATETTRNNILRARDRLALALAPGGGAGPREELAGRK